MVICRLVHRKHISKPVSFFFCTLSLSVITIGVAKQTEHMIVPRVLPKLFPDKATYKKCKGNMYSLSCTIFYFIFFYFYFFSCVPPCRPINIICYKYIMAIQRKHSFCYCRSFYTFFCSFCCMLIPKSFNSTNYFPPAGASFKSSFLLQSHEEIYIQHNKMFALTSE